MSRVHSFYRVEDGVFTGRTFSGPDAWLTANTPNGCAAWPGLVDRQRQRVQDGTLVDYQPPAPPDDELCSWQWDAQAWAWVSCPTLLALFRAAERYLQTALDAGARAWGYDSVTTAASYIDSTHAQWAAEARVLIDWRDACWLWLASAQAAAEQGAPFPTTEQALQAAMPAQPDRPALLGGES